MWLLALSLLLCSYSGHMVYLESTGELVCQDFVPSCSGEEYRRASRPHSSSHDPAVCRETTAAWSTALAWNHTYPFKQIPIYGSLGQIHRMVFEWLGDLRTFIGGQNPPGGTVLQNQRGHFSPLSSHSPLLDQHCGVLILLFLSWVWPRSAQKWIPQYSISFGQLIGTGLCLPSKMFFSLLLLFPFSRSVFCFFYPSKPKTGSLNLCLQCDS